MKSNHHHHVVMLPSSLWIFIVVLYYCFLVLNNEVVVTTGFVFLPLDNHRHHILPTTISSSHNNNNGMFQKSVPTTTATTTASSRRQQRSTAAIFSVSTAATTTEEEESTTSTTSTSSSEYIPENLMTYQHRVKIVKKKQQQTSPIRIRKRFNRLLSSFFRRRRKKGSSSSSSLSSSEDHTAVSSSSSSAETPTTTTTTILDVTYDYDLLEIGNNDTSTTKTTGIILIQPIGVGISKWFYQRLFGALDTSCQQQNNNNTGQKFIVIAPDLIGCGTATNITITTKDNNNNNINGSSLQQIEDKDNSKNEQQHQQHQNLPKFPLLNISDWTDQIVDLMYKIEIDYPNIDKWCIVANGGCSPIALQVAARRSDTTSRLSSSNSRNGSTIDGEDGDDDGKKEGKEATSSPKLFKKPVTNVILSSVPRLPFFLNSTNDPMKTSKSYDRLCGIIGNVFWWYSCKNQGKFIQKFSEKNLVANPNNLGPYWRTNCYNIAYYNKQSRYSTFAFLAGTLQDGCLSSLNTLIQHNKNNHNNKIQIDTIKGRDTRRNQARSWFWQKKNRRRRKKKNQKIVEENQQPRKTFRDYLEENGLGGKEYMIGGRVSLAHEDAIGYSDVLIRCLSEE